MPNKDTLVMTQEEMLFVDDALTVKDNIINRLQAERDGYRRAYLYWKEKYYSLLKTQKTIKELINE